jgi:cytochrome b561
MSREIAVESTKTINDAAGKSVSCRVSGGKTAWSTDTRRSGFTRPMQAIHWITVVLLLGAYLAAWMIDTDVSSVETDWLVMLHRSFGVAILLATGLRLAIRGRARVPPPADGVTAGLLLAQIGLHVGAALYHHFVRQDGVMAGMLPGMPCRQRAAEFAPGRRLPSGGSRQP